MPKSKAGQDKTPKPTRKDKTKAGLSDPRVCTCGAAGNTYRRCLCN